jgi:copper chaperone CopZ
MKTRSAFLALLLTLSGPVAWAKASEVNVKVKGMVCGFCAQGIEKKFKAHEAVDGIKVSLNEKQVSLKLKEGKTLPDETIKKFLTESGYNVEKIERN